MSFLVENPLPVLFFGVIVAAVLGAVFVSTQRLELLWAILGVAVFVLVMVGLEWLVVTQREEVEATIDRIAEALEANDWDAVKSHLTPDAATTRDRADEARRLVTVTDTKVRNLQIEVNRHTSPPTATARFDGVIYYEPKDHFTASGWYPARFTVEFRELGDRWLVTDHVEVEQQGL
jgi:hypothetical protein